MREGRTMQREPERLDVVAPIVDAPEAGLVAGQVGTVVEPLDALTVRVAFATDEGEPYAVAPLRKMKLLVLRYARVAA
jgi:hypothetical protein